ncbi:MAG: tetratricopeptide repeat protein [Pseudomonadales bacterium]|nr:tetratricopeptide repeat protein [Pseudomonadales bacterium]
MLLRYLTLLTLLGLLTGCTTSSVFMPYPARALSYQQALSTGTPQPALEANKKLLTRQDALLALLEQGRIQQLSGDYTGSTQSFTQALARLDAIEQRAAISLSHTASQGTALLSNDNAIPYQSHDYERIFVHQFQALNYIALGDKEAALVEMRRAQFFQDKQPKAQEQANPLSDNALNEYQNRFSATNDLAQRVKSSRQNAYVLYLAGVLYESKKQFDDAYIDYKRALSIAPDNRFLQEDVARLAKQLNRAEDSKNLSKIKFSNPKANEGTVVVLYEEGFVPAKKELFLPFPWPEAWYTVAFPYYGDAWQSPIALNINAINSQVVTDTQALAARALQDNMVSMLVRQTLRAQTKHKLQQEATDKGGAVLGLLVGAYNFLSENADLRSWLTLPRFAHIARFNLSEGEHTLSLNNSQNINVSVQKQGFTLLHIVNINDHFYVASWPL